MNKRFVLLCITLMLLLSLPVFSQLYNTTNLTNANDPLEQVKALNDIVDGFIGYGILMIAWTITFVVTTFNYGDGIAGMGAAGFFTSLTATILLPLGLIPLYIFQIVILLLAISIVAGMWIKRRATV